MLEQLQKRILNHAFGYELLYQNLSDSLATIGFLFDPLRRRLFLKEYVNFYGDFIHLAEDKHFRIKN